MAPGVRFSKRIVSFEPVFWTLSATVFEPQIVLTDLEFIPVKCPGLCFSELNLSYCPTTFSP